jgi:MFS family permease
MVIAIGGYSSSLLIKRQLDNDFIRNAWSVRSVALAGVVPGSGVVRFFGRGDLPREVNVLAVIAFVVALGFGIVAPAIPLFARAFGVGTTAVGLAVSAFAFFRFVSAFSGGSLVERFGERWVLTAGLLIVAVTTGAAGLASSFPVFLALRAAGGVGSAMFTVAALSLLLRVAPPSHRGRAAARWQGGFILGGIAGPAAGGLLAELSPRLPFFLYAGFRWLPAPSASSCSGRRRSPPAPPRRAAPT